MLAGLIITAVISSRVTSLRNTYLFISENNGAVCILLSVQSVYTHRLKGDSADYTLLRNCSHLADFVFSTQVGVESETIHAH